MNFNNLSFKEKKDILNDLYYRGIDPRSIDILYSQDEVDEYIEDVVRDCAEDDYDRIFKELEKYYGYYTANAILKDRKDFIRERLDEDYNEDDFGFIMVGDYYVQD